MSKTNDKNKPFLFICFWHFCTYWLLSTSGSDNISAVFDQCIYILFFFFMCIKVKSLPFITFLAQSSNDDIYQYWYKRHDWRRRKHVFKQVNTQCKKQFLRVSNVYKRYAYYLCFHYVFVRQTKQCCLNNYVTKMFTRSYLHVYKSTKVFNKTLSCVICLLISVAMFY